MVNAYINALNDAKHKHYGKIYIGCDIHSTILKPTYSTDLSNDYYPYAKEVMQILSNKNNICLILWSCSLAPLREQYIDFFKKDNIFFTFVNENKDVTSTDYADFETKLYFSLGFDDKFGFDANEDWKALYDYLTSGVV